MPETSNQLNIFEAKDGCIAPRKLHEPTSIILRLGHFNASTEGSVPVRAFSDNQSCSRVGESLSKTDFITGADSSPQSAFRESSSTVTRRRPPSSSVVRTPHHSEIGPAPPQFSARVHCAPPRHACRASRASLSEEKAKAITVQLYRSTPMIY